MGSSEETKAANSEKSSSPPVDQANNVHVYPDWAAMQAYYGPRMAVPPYFNSAVASGHAPHPYMWGPQPMMPYGTPYAAMYAHGGVYAHPGVSTAATPNAETPTKSPGNTDQGSMKKKMKGFDGLSMSIGNGNAGSDEGGGNSTQSQSEMEGSSDGSNGNTSGGGRNGRKRSREESTNSDGNGKTENDGVQDKGASERVNASLSGSENVVHPTMALELKNTLIPKECPMTPQACAIIPSEAWMQNERELKKERRKQSNRESARRSRLRKQAEAEELAKRVDALTAENMALKSELNRLAENSAKLKHENTILTENMKKTQVVQTESLMTKKEEKKRVPISTEDLLARVHNSGSIDRNDEGEEMYEKNSSQGGAKLRQLLDASPRGDALAAS